MTLQLQVLLDPPRWPGGPPICPTANLPALPSENALAAFLAKAGPRCSVERIWQCDFCYQWHAATQAPDPTGTTSGTGRGHK